MSAYAMPGEQEEEQPTTLPRPQPEPIRRTEYLVHTTVRTMLGNPSALYHGKVVVKNANLHQQIMTEKMKKKEEKKKEKEEKKLKKLEKKKELKEQKKMKKEEDAQRSSNVAESVQEVAKPAQEVAKPAKEETVGNQDATMVTFEEPVENQGATMATFEEPVENPEETVVTFEEPGMGAEAIYCNSCGSLSYGNKIEYEYSVSTHLTATFLAICCYCWLPYILRCCMDEVYYCSLCGAYLGKTPTLSRRNMI